MLGPCAQRRVQVFLDAVDRGADPATLMLPPPKPRNRPPEKLETLGDHVRAARLERGLTQRNVAQQIGCTVATVTNVELGRCRFSLKLISGATLMGWTPPATKIGIPVSWSCPPDYGGAPMSSTTIAVDIAKCVFQLAISKRPGKTSSEHRLTRSRFLRFLGQRASAIVVLEACCSAHHWARQIRPLGHEVVLLPAREVARYRSGNKTDKADAKAILEAYRNTEILPVPVKSIDQQALTGLHRLRSQRQADRTARLNSLRGILREFGLFIPQGAHKVVPAVWSLVEDADSSIPDILRLAVAEACLEIRELEQRVAAVEKQLRAVIKQLPVAQRLLTIPGIGVLTATALVAFVGDVRRFPSARHFSSFLGLTPRENSSGGKRRLGRITKRGDVYLRTLLVHGSRSVLLAAKRSKQPDHLRSWALRIEALRGHNKAVCALSNKLARIAWAVWNEDSSFQPQPA